MGSNSEYNEKEAELIKAATSIFMTFGIKSVTMDDIASRLRVSKKTLYKYVSNKAELVNKCVKCDCDMMRDRILAIRNRELNAIDESFAISNLVVDEIRAIHPSIFYDLEKYYSDAWQTLERVHYGFISEMVEANLHRGIEEGLYRNDFNIKILTRLWVLRMNLIFTPHHLPMKEFNVSEVYREMVIHHLRGVASERGLEYLREHKNQPKPKP